MMRGILYLCTTEVRGGDGLEALLASSVPDLQLDLLLVQCDGLDLKVDADGCDEGRREAVVGIPQQQAGLADT